MFDPRNYIIFISLIQPPKALLVCAIDSTKSWIIEGNDSWVSSFLYSLLLGLRQRNIVRKFSLCCHLAEVLNSFTIQ